LHAPKGSLVQRELSALGLTEGLLSSVILQPLRPKSQISDTSPYTEEALNPACIKQAG